MKYLDSNVLIYATLDSERKGNWCRKLLNRIENGVERGCTSFLTYDEFFWKVKKERDKETALKTSEYILTFPNLSFFDVDADVIWRSRQLSNDYDLDPRDAIHTASTLNHGVYTLVSEDDDFDRISDINRVWL